MKWDWWSQKKMCDQKTSLLGMNNFPSRSRASLSLLIHHCRVSVHCRRQCSSGRCRSWTIHVLANRLRDTTESLVSSTVESWLHRTKWLWLGHDSMWPAMRPVNFSPHQLESKLSPRTDILCAAGGFLPRRTSVSLADFSCHYSSRHDRWLVLCRDCIV